MQELESDQDLHLGGRVRRAGAGRKIATETNPELVSDIEKIINGSTAGDPMTNLKWTCKSTRNIAEELKKSGHKITHETVRSLLRAQGYSLQTNRKMLSGKNHPDRDAQFKYIDRSVNRFLKNHDPVISVDTKKKELVGNFSNNGQEWRKKGEATKVLDHDFKSLGSGIAVPYGSYDVQRNEGFVNVGVSSDTAEFAVNSIWQWWRHFGKRSYKGAGELLICADGGGSNSSRSRAWKFYLQELSNKIGISITVCHYPPGTSKWNKIEHRMFSFISMNWKGKPLENYESILKLISETKTKSGLKIRSRLDTKNYKKGKKISKEDFDNLSLEFKNKFPLWNYTINPFE
jgi:transposase